MTAKVRLIGILAVFWVLLSGVKSVAQSNGECFENCSRTSRGAPNLAIPNFDQMSEDQKILWLRNFGQMNGFSSSQMDDIIEAARQPNREPAFNEHGDPQGGQDGYAIGCAINAVFFPEYGGCLENDWNRQKWERTKNLNDGSGVLLEKPSVDFDDFMPDEVP